jgi:hypothetical protein
MTAANVRIEIGGAVTLGDNNQIRAHLLVNGKFTTGKSLSMTGAAWAKSINVGTNGFLNADGVFSTQAPSVPPPCNDNNACTVDTCVGGGTSVAFCRNTPAPTGTSCGDGNACNGDELCDATGQCQPVTTQTAGTACADGDLCNGDETCNGFGACLLGTPPVVSDDNTCTVDACDSATGVTHIPLPDGTTCNGVGVCTAGTCSVAFPSSGSFSYSATNTNSATQNTVNFDIRWSQDRSHGRHVRPTRRLGIRRYLSSPVRRIQHSGCGQRRRVRPPEFLHVHGDDHRDLRGWSAEVCVCHGAVALDKDLYAVDRAS